MEPDLETASDYLVSIFNDALAIEESELRKSRFRGLSIAKVHMTEAVGICEKKTTSGVAKGLSITTGTLTTAINELIEEGYAERIRSEDDRRVVELGLTKKGELLLWVHRHLRREMTKNILDEIAIEEQHVLLDALRDLYGFLQDYE